MRLYEPLTEFGRCRDFWEQKRPFVGMQIVRAGNFTPWRSAFRPRDGMAALARTPVLPKATRVGAQSAQLRRPRPRSATSAQRRLATLACSRPVFGWVEIVPTDLGPRLRIDSSARRPLQCRGRRKSLRNSEQSDRVLSMNFHSSESSQGIQAAASKKGAQIDAWLQPETRVETEAIVFYFFARNPLKNPDSDE